jgi:hypothetical protein
MQLSHIFISYSHDDSEYAYKLKNALAQKGFNIWIDERIGYGTLGPRVLQEQLDVSAAVIVIMTSNSYSSDWVHNEVARAQAKKIPIFPLLLEGDNWLAIQATQYVDVRDGRLPPPGFYSTLDEVLGSQGRATLHQGEASGARFLSSRLSSGAPFQAPPLPPHFVPRPEATSELKSQLLSDAPTQPGVLVVSAIHGPGGVGKSTLAAALVHDRDVREHFSDGVLWATLGQQPDLLSVLISWIRVLGDHESHPTTVEAASAQLRTLLYDRASLLVVDDIWDVNCSGLFLVGGTRCRVLVTTRDALIAKSMGATLYSLDVMTCEQSLALINGRLGYKVGEPERTLALTMAKTVGFLPLALELAAAQVADDISWTELLSDLRAEIARLEALDLPGIEEVTDDASRKRLSLLASLYLSLRRLTPERYDMFAWLGVLPEDVSVTSAMTTTLWETDLRTAVSTLRYLQSKALLLHGIVLADGTRTYRLHDLIHLTARRLLTVEQPEGLGITLLMAHASFLDRYRAQTDNGHWCTLVDDGYIYSHLTWHMVQAGRDTEIHNLLREEGPDGRNSWYAAREQLGQTSGYVGDISRAWGLAREASATGLENRYALINASVHSLARQIPPPLLAALVREDIWTPTQAMDCVRQSPDMEHRAKAIIALAQYLPEPVQNEALQVALVAVQAFDRRMGIAEADATAGLAPFLPEPIITEALTITQTLPQIFRTRASVALVVRLATLGQLERAETVALAFEDEYCRALALSALTQYVSRYNQKLWIGESEQSGVSLG